MSKGGSVRNSKQRRSVSNDPCNTEAERKSPSSSVIRTRRQKALPSKVREAIFLTKTDCFYCCVVRIHDHVEAVFFLQLPKDELAASSQVIEPPNNKVRVCFTTRFFQLHNIAYSTYRHALWNESICVLFGMYYIFENQII